MAGVKPPAVPCHACNGSGAVPMPGVYADVLALIHRHGEMSAASLVPLMKSDRVGRTAMNNRLEYLRSQGLLNRRKDSKTWLYSASEVQGGSDGRDA